jgi:hypothetical protein
MTRAGAGLALLLALAPRPAPAEEGRLVAPSQDRMRWSPEHPFGLGARAGLWDWSIHQLKGCAAPSNLGRQHCGHGYFSRRQSD